jgi:hypothetical protein
VKISSKDPEVEVVSDDEELWNMSTKRPKKYLTIRVRRDYTRKKQLDIISFISKHWYHNYLKGRKMWQKAGAVQICPNRTWHSIK